MENKTTNWIIHGNFILEHYGETPKILEVNGEKLIPLNNLTGEFINCKTGFAGFFFLENAKLREYFYISENADGKLHPTLENGIKTNFPLEIISLENYRNEDCFFGL